MNFFWPVRGSVSKLSLVMSKKTSEGDIRNNVEKERRKKERREKRVRKERQGTPLLLLLLYNTCNKKKIPQF